MRGVVVCCVMVILICFLGFIINKTEFPAILPILHLDKLKKIKFGRATFQTNVYAFLKAAMPNTEGCDWDLCCDYQGNFEFLGKRAGYVKKNNPKVKEPCEEFVEKFETMSEEADIIRINYVG